MSGSEVVDSNTHADPVKALHERFKVGFIVGNGFLVEFDNECVWFNAISGQLPLNDRGKVTRVGLAIEEVDPDRAVGNSLANDTESKTRRLDHPRPNSL